MGMMEEIEKSLKRIQGFDPSKLSREEDLGKQLSFSEAVEPARKVVALFNQLPISILSELPSQELNKLKTQADSVFNVFGKCLEFSSIGETEGGTPEQRRNAILKEVQNLYQQAFSGLHPFISFASSRTVDFSNLQVQGRAAIQAIEDKADELTEALQERSKEAASIVEEVRRVAAEQGVSQQAIYFREEADAHRTSANSWRIVTLVVAGILICLAVSSMFIHKWEYLAADNIQNALHVLAGKILVFGTAAYLLALSARNYLSHKHNEIINRHRQNALMTFTALVKASGNKDGQEIVLSHAAACIFAPQSTGYSKVSGSPLQASGMTMADIIPRAVSSRFSGSSDVA
ncbi:conserved protein of unknown function [Candidatus Filomicrobium marinum]|uniref:Uncharacterized protein n=1 Tax=Candidatus Filomicrobium marinum TaxID=1608628 RepID=A0A0D6JIG7_9HYPH|nr:hypothetical protein [Candidatus Filomicrobium marinum]CFX36358.1 conserved protein of unknown function [Candidatus Filomicrobium marinum]CPR21749.1 conserved protein of unknown function [Candidatus Filomicrobium marinum]